MMRSIQHYARMHLRRIREMRGLSQRDLADMIGMNQAQIARAEGMDDGAKLLTYRKCADALGVSLADIFAADASPISSELLAALGRIPPEHHQRILALIELVEAPLPASDQSNDKVVSQ